MVETLPSSVGSEGSIPGLGAKIPHASWPKNQNIKQKQSCNKFNKDSKKKKVQLFFFCSRTIELEVADEFKARSL